MAINRISLKTVSELKCPPGTTRAFLWDNSLTGFGVIAYPTGKKSYCIKYPWRGTSKRYKIGDHGTFTPDQARTEAKALLGDIARGIDPLARKRAAARSRPFRSVAEDFMAEYAPNKCKPATVKDYRSLLDQYILPALGSMRMDSIGRDDVKSLMESIARGGSGKPVRANRAVALVSSIWNRAIETDVVPPNTNPATGLKDQKKERKRKRYLSPDELGRLGDALRRAETVGLPWDIDPAKPTSKHLPKGPKLTKLDPYAIAAIRLLLLTGARLREILHARWEGLDWDNRMLHLPESKTGEKFLYLNEAAIDVLRALPRIAANPYIIPGAGKRLKKGAPKPKSNAAPRADLKRPWEAIYRAAQLENFRIHDLRHTHASIGAAEGVGLQMVGKLLGHTQPQTTDRYSHMAKEPMLKAANVIGDTLTAAMNGKGNVSKSRKGIHHLSREELEKMDKQALIEMLTTIKRRHAQLT